MFSSISDFVAICAGHSYALVQNQAEGYYTHGMDLDLNDQKAKDQA
jgi:hypothetical protein